MNSGSPISQTPWSGQLRILFVEDNPDDYELILRELRRANLDVVPELVQSKSAFVERLLAGPFDVVVADHNLKGWTGMDALGLMRESGKNLPFILVTGALGEEVAVDYIKQGASDYILKDRLARLPVAICKALREVNLKDERRRAGDKLRDSEEMFRTLAETIHSAIFVYIGSHCRYANHEAETITGYTRGELLGMNSLALIHAESRDVVIQMGFSNAQSDMSPRHCEAGIITKSGEQRWLDMTASIIDIEGKRGALITASDITERKKGDAAIQRLVASDALTGLANYRHLVNAFDSELDRSRRTGRSFSLVLLDLDGLKLINDSYGHVVGSRAICRVADVLRSKCRHLDIAARYGGDEFAVILPETGVDGATFAAQRLAQLVQSDKESPKLSVSFGLAACPDHGNSLKEMLRIADGGLYLMKGRQSPEPRHYELSV